MTLTNLPQLHVLSHFFKKPTLVSLNRADPFYDRDATDWQIINLPNGRVELNYTLYNKVNRIVRYNAKTKHPEDSVYQSENTRIPPQTH